MVSAALSDDWKVVKEHLLSEITIDYNASSHPCSNFFQEIKNKSIQFLYKASSVS
jgi:hypothetical protein